MQRKKFKKLNIILNIALLFFLLPGNFVLAEDVDVTATVPVVCGDYLTEGDEACDDGPSGSDDCTAECKTPGGTPICVPNGLCAVTSWSGVCVGGIESGTGINNCGNPCAGFRPCAGASCGNGIIDPPLEQCDNGAANSDVLPNACRTSCINAYCGDGVIDSGEECDGAPNCSVSCELLTGCGNGITEVGEECDDNNTTSGDCCSASCQIELLIENVTVAPITNTSGTVSWTTRSWNGAACSSITSDSTIDWGKTITLGDGTANLSGSSYSYAITSLDSNTSYNYKITATYSSLVAISTGSFLTLGGVEDCQNGIDDDNDGLVDIEDSDCPCNTEWECTPADWDDVECIDGEKVRDCQKINNCWNDNPLPEETMGCQDPCAGVTCPPNYELDNLTCECNPLPAECGNDICEPPTEDPYNCPTDCPVTCLSEWNCTDWSPEQCPVSGIQTRDCFDENACKTPINKPPTQQSCGAFCQGLSCGACQRINIDQCTCEENIPCCGNGFCEDGESNLSCAADCVEFCKPSWTCLNWSECSENGTQTRECYDVNGCAINLDKPPEIRACGGDCEIACGSCQTINTQACSCNPTVPCCGNRICENNETIWSCPVDCGIPPTVTITLTSCLDGLDNDGDGLVDYPADPGCGKPTDRSELNFDEVIENVAENINEGIKALEERVFNNPKVEKFNERLATPITATAVAVNAVSSFSLFNFLSYARYAFSQPFAIFFRRKRKKWGTVYNSLTKKPVDLAIVRLYKKENGQLIQSRVTDKEGRYTFIAPPGRYYMTVTKSKFNFPTDYLKEKKEDVKFLDLYHGETVEVTNDRAVITANIPVDPQEDTRTPKQLIVKYYLRKLQYAVAFSAVPFAALSMVISPGLMTFALFIFHTLLFVLFRRLSYQKPPKSWGVVYNEGNKKPVGLAITRIYDKKYNKLLESRVTDAKGRYSFLVDNNVYYLTVEKLGYNQKKTQDIDLIGQDKEAVVGLDVGLKKGQVSKSAEQKSQIESEDPADQSQKETISDIEKKVENLEVGRKSLEDLMESKKQAEEISQEIEEKKEELEELEHKVEGVQKEIESELGEKQIVDEQIKESEVKLEDTPKDNQKPEIHEVKKDDSSGEDSKPELEEIEQSKAENLEQKDDSTDNNSEDKTESKDKVRKDSIFG